MAEMVGMNTAKVPVVKGVRKFAHINPFGLA